MPNTLAHIGVQGITTKSIFKFADLKWIYLGCIIPDLPWILQRLLRNSHLFNLYDVRDYSIILASLLFCAILSASLSLFSKNSGKVFFILVFSCLFHLLLDPLQIKWANGVHLFVPFSWHLLSFNLFWPESIPTYIITAFGFFYLIFNYKKAVKESSDLIRPKKKRIFLSISILVIYLFAPLFILNLPEQNNNHFVKTLRNYNSRTGKFIELDRTNYLPDTSGNFIKTFAEEKIKAVNLNLRNESLVSIRGRFISPNVIYVEDYHIHTSFRDDASYAGVLLILILWIHILFKEKMDYMIRIIKIQKQN
jgi:hypothetical protein